MTVLQSLKQNKATQQVKRMLDIVSCGLVESPVKVEFRDGSPSAGIVGFNGSVHCINIPYSNFIKAENRRIAEGQIVHESFHHKYSKFEWLIKAGAEGFGSLCNAIEDPRVNTKGMKEYRGARQIIELRLGIGLSKGLLLTYTGNGYQDICALTNYYLTVKMQGSKILENAAVELFETMKSVYGARVVSELVSILNRCARECDSSKSAYVFAKEIHLWALQQDGEPQSQQPKPQDENLQGKNEESNTPPNKSGLDDKSESNKLNSSNEGNDKSDKSNPSSASDKDDSEAPSDSYGDKDDSEAPSDSDSDKDDSEAPSDSDSDKDDSEAPSDSDSDKDDSEAPSDSDSDKDDSEAPSDQDGLQQDTSKQCKDYEQSISESYSSEIGNDPYDLSLKLMVHLKSEAGKSNYQDDMPTPLVINNITTAREYISKIRGQELLSEDEIFRSANMLVAKIRNPLDRILKAKNWVRESINRKGDEISGSNLYRCATDGKCFVEETRGIAMNTSVITLIDRSSSMSGDNINSATVSGVALGLALEKLNVKNKIASYSSCELGYFTHKASNALMRNSRNTLRIPTSKSTPTGDAIVNAISDFSNDTSEKKLIILLTDGVADNITTALMAIELAEEKNIRVIVIGLGKRDCVFAAYKNVYRINSHLEIASAFIKITKDNLF
ncbi:vWA domain-containing protein [Aliivibrio salmonicida]|uniref:vWA domain-containing protein n=1 Tax=Aliivibrio salmonicida TaxID=40269 RepID=UPI0030A52CAC